MRLGVLAIALAASMTVGVVGQSRQKPAGTSGTTSAPTAKATLVDAQGRSIGNASLQQTPHGVLLKLALRDATPGVHAVHIHETGRCDAPSFESAGEHFDPSGRRHGFFDASGPHAGDLPNIEVPATKQISVEHLIRGVTLGDGPGSLIDGDGSAIVIHVREDDYRSDPSGESGDRIACGQIVR